MWVFKNFLAIILINFTFTQIAFSQGRKLTLNGLQRHCQESGATNFDPTNLAYLTDSNQTFSYSLNVAYGNHDNNADGVIDSDKNNDGFGDLDNFRNRRVFDIFYHRSGGKRPAVIHFHGGGFSTGDKCLGYNYRSMPIKEILKAGVVYIGVNYRFLGYTNSQGKKVPYPNHQGIKVPLADGKRLIQVIRANADRYNIDKKRILVIGESAGAGIGLWNATRNDGADRSSTSRVAQQSTKPNAVMAIDAQATYDFHKWESQVFHQGSNFLYTRWRYAQYESNQTGKITNYEFDFCKFWNYAGQVTACDTPNNSIPESAINFYGHANGIKVALGYSGVGEPGAEPDLPIYQQYLNDTAKYRKQVDILGQISKDDPVMYIESLGVPDNVTAPTARDVYHSKFHGIALAYLADLNRVKNQLLIGYQRNLDQRWYRWNFIYNHIVMK